MEEVEKSIQELSNNINKLKTKDEIKHAINKLNELQDNLDNM